MLCLHQERVRCAGSHVGLACPRPQGHSCCCCCKQRWQADRSAAGCQPVLHSPAGAGRGSLKLLPSPLQEVDEVIGRDINRTFPEHPQFGFEQGQQALFRVLKAYSLHDLEVSYDCWVKDLIWSVQVSGPLAGVGP